MLINANVDTVLNILSGSSQPEPTEATCVEDVSSAGAGSSDNIAFTVLSKKGNKQQVIVC